MPSCAARTSCPRFCRTVAVAVFGRLSNPRIVMTSLSLCTSFTSHEIWRKVTKGDPFMCMQILAIRNERACTRSAHAQGFSLAYK